MTASMRRVERRGNVRAVGKSLSQGQRSNAREPVGEGLPFDELHHQVVDSILVTDVVKRADVRMRQRADRSCFLGQPLTQPRIVVQPLGKNLDRHRTIEPRVTSAVYRSHAAGPDLLNDLVGSQRSPWSELHRNRIDDAERGEP